MRCGLILAFAWLLAGAALAQSGREPFVEAVDAGGGATRVRAQIDIDAPPAAVWSVLTDCGQGPKIIPHLESCKILERDPAGRWDVRDHVVNPPLLPRIRTIVRNDFTPERKLAFRLVGGDMKRSDGAWTLEPIGKGVRLSYDSMIELGFYAPQFLVARSIESDFPTMLRNVKINSERRAR